VLLDSADSPDDLHRMLQRRLTGEPLEQVVGWVQFGGRSVRVAPGVFVPRQRTQLLATQALRAASRHARPVVVELCCGAAPIATVVAAGNENADVYASDVDDRAVACARSNLAPLGASALRGGLYSALPADLRRRVDVLTANAPYVPSAGLTHLPVEARDYEPRSALDGGADGLTLLRAVIAGAGEWLSPRGVVLLECGWPQVDSVLGELAAHGLDGSVMRDDDLGAVGVTAGWSRPPTYGDHTPDSASTTTSRA
jgi:release factor glutamine methyltransferase